MIKTNYDYGLGIDEKDLKTIESLKKLGVFKYKLTRDGEVEIIFFQDVMGSYDQNFNDLKQVHEHPSQVELFEKELKEIDKAKDDLFRGGL